MQSKCFFFFFEQQNVKYCVAAGPLLPIRLYKLKKNMSKEYFEQAKWVT